MIDLNGLIPPDSTLYLVSAYDINSRGEIVGQAFDENTGDAPAFRAIPIQQETQLEGPAAQGRKRVILPEGLRQFINKRRGLARF